MILAFYEEMVERGIIATRQFAKRQYTWLRREEEALRLCSEEKGLQEKALKGIARPFWTIENCYFVA